jgi:hypothetical protein
MGGCDAVLNAFGAERVESSGFARVWRFTAQIGGREGTVYLKRYLPRSFMDRLKHLFRAGRARRAFRAGLLLDEAGFDGPELLAAGCGFLGRGVGGQFLLTAEVGGASAVSRLLPCFSGREKLDRKGRFIRAFAQTVARLHTSGIFHGDLRLGNVLAREEGGSWRFFFLDNERTGRFRRIPHRLRVKNLVQANMYRGQSLTNADRMRFFRRYADCCGLDGLRRRRLARAVADKTLERFRAKDLRKRP